MCDTHAHPPAAPRAISLDDAAAHARDHAAWTRRDFLSQATAAAAGAFVLGTGAQARTVRASSHTPLLQLLGGTETERVLVIVQLGGGNDGLNMVVPYTSGAYYSRRPTIAQPRASLLTLDADYGLNGAMQALAPVWGRGDLAVVHSAGYPSHSRSHFRSTDVWASASRADEVRSDGWTGRYVDRAYPGHAQTPLDFPVAVRIGGASSLLVRGAGGALGMSFSDAGQLQRLAETGQFYDEADVPPTQAGAELGFVRQVYNSGLRYRDAVYGASQAGTNDGSAAYPTGGLGDSLAAVARLVKGGLGSRVYAVSIGGFDTHADQLMHQTGLLAQIATAVAAFYTDLGATGDAGRVLTMTFSEFGRTVSQNGSAGTDHAEASPMLLFGGGVGGGLYGDGPGPVLDTLPAGASALPMSVDFRRVYASVLRQWFGLAQGDAEAVLGGAFSPLDGLVDAATVAAEPDAAEAGFSLGPVAPNPVRGRAVVPFALDRAGTARLRVLDLQGRTVLDAPRGALAAGPHTATLDVSALAAGVYLVRLDAASGGGSASRTVTITVVR